MVLERKNKEKRKKELEIHKGILLKNKQATMDLLISLPNAGLLDEKRRVCISVPSH